MADKFGDNGSDNQEEASFAEMFASYDAEINHDIRQGDKIEGKIISIGQNAVYISTGAKSDGVVDKAELLDKNGEFNHAVGDKISLYVVSMNESEITLSKSLSGAGTATMLEEASFTGTPVEGKVAGTIKGGFSVTIMGKRAFCPVSQMDIKYVEDTESYVGSTFNFIITRFERGGPQHCRLPPGSLESGEQGQAGGILQGGQRGRHPHGQRHQTHALWGVHRACSGC